MKFTGVSLVSILWVLNCQSQSINPADSLQDVLKKYTTADTVRANTLLNYINSLLYTRPDPSLLTYAEEALSISKKTGWSKGEATALQRIGTIYSFVLADNVKAYPYYLQALDANEKVGNKTFQWQTLANIGLLFFNAQQYQKSLYYYKQALQIAEDIKANEAAMLQLKGNMGNVYAELQQPDSALILYDYAINTSRKINNPLFLSNFLSTAGVVLNRKNLLDSAEKSLKESIVIADSVNNPLVKAISLNNLALTCNLQKKPRQALPLAKQGMQILEQLNATQWKVIGLQTLSDIYYSSGNYKDAMDNFQKSIAMKDSIINSSKNVQMGVMEATYEYEKNKAITEAAYETQLSEQKFKRNVYLGIAGLLIAGGMLFFWVYKRRRDATVKQKEAELKAEISATEMKALRAQMNPHFIFNSLNSIGDYISRNNIKLADEYLTKFAKLMRLILENSEHKAVPLIDDLKALQLYMELEAIRMNNKFSFEIKVDTAIESENTLVPPLILQPFVENSIWHGIAKKEGTGKIIVAVRKTGDMIVCTVEDDGIGRTAITNEIPVNKPVKKSLGMKITEERIDMLNKIKNTSASVKVHDLTQGTRVEIQLPLEQTF
ncbi:MAG: tetratricopeptide repeat protein [Chitinophagaceae bacterium]|nr:tetratricopeptide repeat protein [Chitinophagaceae bacterium]